MQVNALISRSAAKDEILSWAVCLNKPHLLSRDDTMYVLDTLPAVDAVEVVRCKDCKWLYDGEDMYCCTNHTGLALISRDGLSFCSYGATKEA